MNRKLGKILIIVFATLIIVAGIALAVLYYMGDRIVEEAIRDEISLENSKSGQADQGVESNGTESVETAGSVGNEAAEENPGTASTGLQQQADEANPSSGTEQISNQASGATEKITSKNKNSKKKVPVITETKVAEIKNEVTAEDKISAAALILKRLTTDDINELKDLLADGLSEEEKEKAKELAYSKFSKEEIADIKEMYAKYMY